MDTNEQAKLQSLASELGDDVAVIKEFMADYKRAGLKAALAENSADLIREAQEDFAAVTSALPVIKAGWKTTEFWLIAAVILANAAYFAATEKVLPFDLNAVFASLVGVYAIVRGFMKKPAVVVAPVVAPVQP
ncbi:MAG TPA: hypothetical protein VNT99_20325 [Methylomirabilota bacterium]|nr:hypothetical protein [Methylomirabilota bacterium]